MPKLHHAVESFLRGESFSRRAKRSGGKLKPSRLSTINQPRSTGPPPM